MFNINHYMHYFIVRELVNSQYRNGKLLHRRAESQNGITHILNIKLYKKKNTYKSHPTNIIIMAKKSWNSHIF